MCNPDRIARLLGYEFQDRKLLLQSLTPPSSGLPDDNQRLEFLGDALLHCCIGILIYREKPDWDEGRMSKLRNILVNVDSLREWAEDLGIELIRGPRSPRKPTPQGIHKPLSDAVEAMLAAVHQDSSVRGADAFGTVMGIVEHRFMAEVRDATPGIWESVDSKTTLQEKAAALGLPSPRYELMDRSGPDHQPAFRVRVSVGDHSAEATGGSLKRAQVEAARILLRQL